jgi:hypothetical protein
MVVTFILKIYCLLVEENLWSVRLLKCHVCVVCPVVLNGRDSVITMRIFIFLALVILN